jgi:hypothetical protein
MKSEVVHIPHYSNGSDDYFFVARPEISTLDFSLLLDRALAARLPDTEKRLMTDTVISRTIRRVDRCVTTALISYNIWVDDESTAFLEEYKGALVVEDCYGAVALHVRPVYTVWNPTRRRMNVFAWMELCPTEDNASAYSNYLSMHSTVHNLRPSFVSWYVRCLLLKTRVTNPASGAYQILILHNAHLVKPFTAKPA